MCGAINLIAINGNGSKRILRPILYNLGRIVSYTITGAVVGLIGNVISINNNITGIITLLSSILMILMALGMLEIIKFRIPKFISIRSKSRSSFVIGLLNGLMPCGPLQAMQIYALSTGSVLKGALSMLLFGIGTIPIMLFFGIAANMFSNKGINIINKIAPMLLLVLSIIMLNRSLLTLNIDALKIFDNYNGYESSIIENNYQVIEFDLNYNSYEDFVVQKDIPVKMIINVNENNLTICNQELKIKEFNIIKKLEIGKNIIEFTPNETGLYTYTCWMDMIKNNIKVVDDINHFKEVNK
jgi:sulfite exporter TauE/SafE